MPHDRMDVDPGEHFIIGLADRTGVPAEKIRRMTCGPLLPRNKLAQSGPALYESYVRSCGVLLGQSEGEPKSVDAAWRPWLSKKRFDRPWHCPQCYAEEGRDHYVRIHWRFPLTAVCPKHNVFLIDSGDLGIIKLGPQPEPRTVHPTLRVQDAALEHALVTGQFTLPKGFVPIEHWLQLFRRVLDELNTTVSKNRAIAQEIHGIWQWSKLNVRAGAAPRCNFENLTPQRQVQFIEAAAMAFALIADGHYQGRGPDANEFRRPRSGRPDYRPSVFHPFRNLFGAHDVSDNY